MATISCALDAISTPAGCNRRGSIKVLYWTEYANVDWDAMAGNALMFNPTTQTILDYTMVGAGVFKKVEFEPKGSFYDNTYTKDAGVYSLLLTMLFSGKDVTRRNSLMEAVQCCSIVVHAYGYDGKQRVFGVDWDGEAFQVLPTPLTVTRHLDSSGQLGSSESRDEVDLGGESFYAPLFATVAEADIPL